MGIAVVGMHRSGTSAVGGILSGLGLDAGGPELAPQHENPRGYFERYDVGALNDSWLATLGGNWWAPPRTHEATWGALDTQRIRRDRATLDILSPDRPPWLVKDPRISLLLPLWDRLALRRLPAVLVLRDPRESASSLSLRDGFPERRSFILWYSYVHRAATFLADRDMLVLSYPAILDRPRESVDVLADFASDVTGIDVSSVDLDAVAGQIDPRLRRQTARDEHIIPAEHLDDCLELFQVLAKAHGQRELPHHTLPAVPRWVDAGLDELSELYTLRDALEKAERERDDLARAFDGGLRTTMGMARARRPRRWLAP